MGAISITVASPDKHHQSQRSLFVPIRKRQDPFWGGDVGHQTHLRRITTFASEVDLSRIIVEPVRSCGYDCVWYYKVSVRKVASVIATAEQLAIRRSVCLPMVPYSATPVFHLHLWSPRRWSRQKRAYPPAAVCRNVAVWSAIVHD